MIINVLPERNLESPNSINTMVFSWESAINIIDFSDRIFGINNINPERANFSADNKSGRGKYSNIRKNI